MKCCLPIDEAAIAPDSPSTNRNPETSGAKIRLSHWVVAYLDILGYRQLLKGMSRNPTALQQNDPDLTEATVRAITVRRDLIGMIEQFKLAMEGLSDRPIDGLPPRMQEIRKAWSKMRVKLAHYSDSVMLYMSLHDATDGDLRMGHLHNMMIGCCGAQLMQLARGHDDLKGTLPLRGAIDVDMGTEFADRLYGAVQQTDQETDPALMQLYSAALATAYELEQTVAVYPRVIVSDAFRAMLNAHIEDRAGTDYQANANRAFAARSATFLTQDDDGVWFVDFLGDGFRSISTQLGQLDMAGQAWKYVQAAYAFHRSSGDPVLTRKYLWLRNYMVSRIAAWGVRE